MKEAQEFLDTWINDTRNEPIKNEYKEYSEREVVEMLKEYKDKFSLSGVVSTCCLNKHVVSDCDSEWCKNCGHVYN